MALRRALLTVAVLAATLLVLAPGPALAAPQWLAGRAARGAPSVGRSRRRRRRRRRQLRRGVARPRRQVKAAYRPRGGPWERAGGPRSRCRRSTATPRASPPSRTASSWPSGWRTDQRRVGYPLRWARRPAGGDWSAPDTDRPASAAAPASPRWRRAADGSVTVVSTDEGSPSSNTKPPGSETWGPGEFVPTGSGSRFAFGADGSAVAVGRRPMRRSVACLEASHRPPGGTWGDVETAGTATDVSAAITGFEVAATPGVGLQRGVGRRSVRRGWHRPAGPRAQHRPHVRSRWGVGRGAAGRRPGRRRTRLFQRQLLRLASARTARRWRSGSRTGAAGDRIVRGPARRRRALGRGRERRRSGLLHRRAARGGHRRPTSPSSPGAPRGQNGAVAHASHRTAVAAGSRWDRDAERDHRASRATSPPTATATR